MSNHSPDSPADPNRFQIAQMRHLAHTAAGVCMRGTVVTDEFSPIVRHPTTAEIEPGGGVPANINAEMAFTAAFFVPGYGAASSASRFSHSMSVLEGRKVWNNNVAAQYHRAARPQTFRRLFFNNGLWQIFLDPEAEETAGYRERFEAGDIVRLRRDPELRDLVEAIRAEHFHRTDSLPHITSHTDAMRFSNTVLHIAERSWRVTDSDEKVALLEKNLSEMRRLALWHTREVNHAAYFMVNQRDSSRYSERFVRTDRDKGKVSFDLPAIEAEVLRREPESRAYARRGCSVLSLSTSYEGRQVPIFTVMNHTIVRMYRATGAVALPALRALPRPMST